MRIRYSIVWVAFLAFTLTGASLLLSADDGRRNIGLVLLLAPLLALGAVLALYYWKSRRDA